MWIFFLQELVFLFWNNFENRCFLAWGVMFVLLCSFTIHDSCFDHGPSSCHLEERWKRVRNGDSMCTDIFFIFLFVNQCEIEDMLSSWLLIGFNLYERMWINQMIGHTFGLLVVRFSERWLSLCTFVTFALFSFFHHFVAKFPIFTFRRCLNITLFAWPLSEVGDSRRRRTRKSGRWVNRGIPMFVNNVQLVSSL